MKPACTERHRDELLLAKRFGGARGGSVACSDVISRCPMGGARWVAQGAGGARDVRRERRGGRPRGRVRGVRRCCGLCLAAEVSRTETCVGWGSYARVRVCFEIVLSLF